MFAHQKHVLCRYKGLEFAERDSSGRTRWRRTRREFPKTRLSQDSHAVGACEGDWKRGSCVDHAHLRPCTPSSPSLTRRHPPSYTPRYLPARVMSRSPSPVIRRATRTYGRRRDTFEHDISFDVGNTSIESREDSLSSTSLPLDHELPPSSDDLDASNTSYVSARAEDADDSDNESPDEGAGRFQFAWRAGLNKIDADEYEPSAHPNAQDPHEETSEGIPRVPTRPASPTDQATQDAFGGTLSSLTATAQSSSLIIHKRAPRRLEALPPSEPESDADLRVSTPQTSPRHPINTPQTRSSPTPPTSIEMSSHKGKGKQREASSLAFSVESADDLPSNAKPATGKRQKKPKASGATKRVKVGSEHIGIYCGNLAYARGLS